ncbi:MAG: polyphosphate kinase 1 [Calditrichaceae bacterium]
MAANENKKINFNKYYINREISWLSFNARVLQEAADSRVPLLERVKFLGIFSNNLDEFFRVRVGTLQRMVHAGIKGKTELGGSPKKILKQIHDVVIEQRKQFDEVFREVIQELEANDIFMIDEHELNVLQEKFVDEYFKHEVRPRLVPIMLDKLPEFPYLRNQVIYLVIHLFNKNNHSDKKYALIEIPVDVLPRFVVLPNRGKKISIIMLDDIIRFGLRNIFEMFEFDSHKAYTIKLTRDAEIDIEDDVTQSFFQKISESIKQRQMGEPVRIVYDRHMPKELLNFILEKNDLSDFENIIGGGRYHNARDFIGFPKIGPRKFLYKNEEPHWHPLISKHKSIFNAIREKDILLQYPYHSFHHFIDLLREAAIDTKVTSIRVTLYRVASKSNVVNALINAIKNGKKVTVVMELQARFDEEANIYWTQLLRDAGAHVIDGVPGLKVHAKLCLITRHEDGKKVRYASIGTGNFNESTATIYSDHSFITINNKITREVKKVFDFFNNNYKVTTFKHLLVAPWYMRKKLIRMIRNEAKNALVDKPAYIHFKLNSLVDRDMINELYKASQAGVKIKIIARGICSLIPGAKGVSENIEAISIVDKYLEHSRIFIFCNNDQPLYYISSADWMIRNLDNRVEVAAPIYDPEIQKELKLFFDVQWRDNTKSRLLNVDNLNKLRQTKDRKKCRAQVDMYKILNN